ncbi:MULTISPECIES: SDR family oxidoreductase [Serratia]|uniref:SDR family oxidoreductase n=1 Tax=Serratia fonticola TaxID=47917 RepID=A0AAJ1YH26_SERFO|nr:MULTISPECIES: SDR family oxidoreductase [Serratia]MBE0149739.1 SDR family oxidoreductase [Serratia fonticola]MDQ7209749.1 SDR family oxidoreductase [Serratia fonticola]MDQ9129122.1 SDR family oxidoreductase [Serratia fonticola]OKP31509.1 3-oxoacyl-ACP reductase [Serratia fonticola]CAI2090242.1 3-oxoacyl-[acyl-carrier-protein] reductase FabG [Serratia fonticola]
MTRQWVLVTGGSRGIGRALVEELAKRWNVVLTCRSDQSPSAEVIEACAGLPGWVENCICDGSDEQAVNLVAPDLLTRLGAPLAVIHNAGITQDSLHIQQTSERWRQVIDTNLNAVFYWNRHLLPAMMGQGEGAMVLMSSVTGIKGNVGQTAYAASKSAMIGLAKSLALEVARFNIRVNCLLPGIIHSEMTDAIPPEALKALRKQIPLRRLGKASEVARAAVFLIGDDSRYMTGQSLILDGGLTA